ARTVLARTSAAWDLAHKPIPPDALYAWIALARRLTPRPSSPDLKATWVELLPACAPGVGDRTGVERFVEWLSLCELLWDYDESLRDRLTFGTEQVHMMVVFLTRVEQAHLADAPTKAIAEPVPRALDSIAKLAPELAGFARPIRGRLRRETAIATSIELGPAPVYY